MPGLHVMWLVTLLFTGINAAQKPPNIVFILADDLGWNDVGFTGRSELQTPNIDALAYNGRILTQHYALPICTPSRAALMTGKYPIRTGMQGYPLSPAEPRALPLDQRLMPQYLKQLGYQTHLVGKWHLGYHEWRYTPTERGFDSHFGYFNGFIGYYDHVMDVRNQSGHDFWRNKEPQYSLQGRYVTDLLTEEAVRLIAASGRAKHSAPPLFLLLSHLVGHTGNAGSELEYPEQDIARFSYIRDENRRKYAAMVWNLDKSVGQVVNALAKHGMLDNSVIVFASDNGAPTVGMFANSGSNYPLRGIKFTVFEGGVRTVAAVWTPRMATIPREVSHQLFHITDWLPTLYEAAGGDWREVGGHDGHSQWAGLHGLEHEARHELLVNVDEATGQRAVRHQNWKLVNGTRENGTLDGYFGNYSTDGYVYSVADVSTSLVSRALRSLRSRDVATKAEVLALRGAATVHCEPRDLQHSKLPRGIPCDPAESACLFDVRADPCETSNVASVRPDVVAALAAKLETYMEQLKPQLNVADDPHANPRLYGDTWVPWHEKKHVSNNVPGATWPNEVLTTLNHFKPKVYVDPRMHQHGTTKVTKDKLLWREEPLATNHNHDYWGRRSRK